MLWVGCAGRARTGRMMPLPSDEKAITKPSAGRPALHATCSNRPRWPPCHHDETA